jgi:predicted HAD superfamily Cof-like phosphohydrolase
LNAKSIHDLIADTDRSYADWVNDIRQMHDKFKVRDAVETFDKEKLRKFLEFRINFLQEELDEMKKAFADGGPDAADDVVDALIDLSVVAIGTLDAYQVDSDLAWRRVHSKNMQKEIGIKEGRVNPLGLPDLVKPASWSPPSHADNVGLLGKAFE